MQLNNLQDIFSTAEWATQLKLI